MPTKSVVNAKRVARSLLSLNVADRQKAVSQDPGSYKSALDTLSSYIGPDKTVGELFRKLRYWVK